MSENVRAPLAAPALAARQDSPARPEEAPVSVALVGFGTVGRSVARILASSPSRLRLTHIVNRDVQRKRVDWLPGRIRWSDNFEDALDDSVDVVVELVGGLEPAKEWVRRALATGKSVVTANKQLIAYHGPELLELARHHGCQLAFGASVAGGVPVVSGLQEGLAGDHLFKVSGILNGTCNYILSKIEEGGVGFAGALREAQQLGYAESDPTDDVEGFDARAKLAILARVGLNCEVAPGDIACRSIASLEAVDFLYARDLGCTIRQVSSAELRDDHLFAAVQPALVPLASPLARVQGSQNLVMATGEFGGETVFSGYGAGGHPTAVAVVSDLIAIAQGRINGFHSAPVRKIAVSAEFSAVHHLRFTVSDRPGIIAAVSGILAKHGISIEAVHQKPGYPKTRLPFVMTLEACPNSLVQRALEELRHLDFMVEPILSLPMLP
ncbi:MAG TPA: homoserine dehydrogenase [Terriglobales bacterium]|nr:homoserine dehydrogenase [Terriglobales bacterium]